MKKLKTLLAVFAVVAVGFAPVVFAPGVLAVSPIAEACDSSSNTENRLCGNQNEDADTLIKTVVNTMLFIVGILSVIMIIVSGILYTTSSGDSGKVSKAKNTLTYSIVGLVVAFLAYAIVNWVFNLL